MPTRENHRFGIHAQCSWRSATALLVVLCGLNTGCDRFESRQEVVDAPVDLPAAPPPATVIPEAPPVTPEQTIAAFQQLPQGERNDDRLLALAATPGAVDLLTELDLRESAVTDLGAETLPRFTAVTRLNLSHARVGGGALRYVAQMPALTALIINDVPLGNEPLVELSRLTGLRELSLVRTAIEDQGFEQLAQIDALQSLDVSFNERLLGNTFSELVKEGRFSQLTSLAADETQFGVAGLQHVGKLTRLQSLRLTRSGVSDEALEDLRSCAELRILFLGGNALTSPGLKPLARLKQLEELHLDACPTLADPALNHLRGLKQLRRLDLEGTTCSPAAVQQLKERFLTGTIVRFGGKEL